MLASGDSILSLIGVECEIDGTARLLLLPLAFGGSASMSRSIDMLISSVVLPSSTGVQNAPRPDLARLLLVGRLRDPRAKGGGGGRSSRASRSADGSAGGGVCREEGLAAESRNKEGGEWIQSGA